MLLQGVFELVIVLSQKQVKTSLFRLSYAKYKSIDLILYSLKKHINMLISWHNLLNPLPMIISFIYANASLYLKTMLSSISRGRVLGQGEVVT